MYVETGRLLRDSTWRAILRPAEAMLRDGPSDEQTAAMLAAGMIAFDDRGRIICLTDAAPPGFLHPQQKNETETENESET